MSLGAFPSIAGSITNLDPTLVFKAADAAPQLTLTVEVSRRCGSNIGAALASEAGPRRGSVLGHRRDFGEEARSSRRRGLFARLAMRRGVCRAGGRVLAEPLWGFPWDPHWVSPLRA